MDVCGLDHSGFQPFNPGAGTYKALTWQILQTADQCQVFFTCSSFRGAVKIRPLKCGEQLWVKLESGSPGVESWGAYPLK